MKALKKGNILIISLFLLINTLAAQQNNTEIFLGRWISDDNNLEINIIKENNLYYIIEFQTIKHELYFSGDFSRVVFQEWGKGPAGYSCGLKISADGRSLGYYGLSDYAEWVFSKTFYRYTK